MELGKIPPSAIDLEEAVLGAIMLEKNAIIEVGGFLKVEHFYSEPHQIIYQAILDLFAAGNPIDMRSVFAELRKSGKVEVIGGASYIAELTSKVSSAANIEYHCRIIVELAIKRSLILIASEIQNEAYDDTVDVFDLYARTEVKLQAILDRAVGNRAEKSMKELAYRVILQVQARQAGKIDGIKSNFNALDRLLGGLKPTDLIIIAARPSVGKTAYAMQLGFQIGEDNIPVGIFSLEMSGEQLVERQTISESEIISEKVKHGSMDNYEFERWSNGTGKISTLPIFIDDTASLSIVELRARAIRMKMKYDIKVIIVDYLQLVKAGDRSNKANRDQEIGMITRTLKAIAKELSVPVIALSQLSRAVEQRGGAKRPQLSDLRESGSIEQDADIVCFLYRPELYGIQIDDEGCPTTGLCEVIVAKHRNGAVSTIKQKFVGKFTKFYEWTGAEGSYLPLPNSDYVKQHSKSVLEPDRLPSEKSEKDFEATDDLPF